MRPPEFWSGAATGRDQAHMLRAVLTPVSWAYSWAAQRRMRTTTARHAPVPVVCVGNLTVGGAGKTPVARAVRAVLGAGAHTLSRGYGGRVDGPLRVTPDMDAREVGDEPLLHAADGAAWIARDRVAGALAAANAGAHAIVMDDGFQNPELGKDLSIVVIDAVAGIGNGAVFPAGPLREKLEDGLARAHALVFLHNTPRLPESIATRFPWLGAYRGAILHAQLAPLADPPAGPLVAFAGIARPQKFFDTLAALGAQLEETVPYDDHHVFRDTDLDWLSQMADERGARLITTEKDAARLTPEWRARVSVLPVAARFDDPAALEALLAPIKARMA